MNKNHIFHSIAVVVVCLPFAALAADQASQLKPTVAKMCVNCHAPEANTLQGHFDSVAFKAKTLQMKIDDSVELIRFDEDEIKVVNREGKTGDGDLLKDNKVTKGQEIKVQYIESGGVKKAVKLVVKPPVKLPPEMLITTAEIEKLVAQGPEKGKYFLFDSRPLPRFQEGAIPTAVNMPYPSFDKMVDKLPQDKSALLIFYCAGPSCTMSPGSADKAKKLGYSNIKVYRDGMPAWSERNYGVVSVQSLKELWIDKDIPHVLLDVRSAREAAKGFIKGAVSFPADKSGKLLKELPPKAKKPPIIVYDGKDGRLASMAAKSLIKSGYERVMLLTGGIDAWRAARFDLAEGKLNTKASYTPKPRPGEIKVEEFKKYAAELPENVMIIDVRNADEAESGIIKNAKQIPVEEIKDRTPEIPRDKLIITQCATGVRAEMAYHTLKSLGYANVRFLNAKMNIQKNGSYKLTVE